MIKPIDEVCPSCNAAIGAKCTIPITNGMGGSREIDTFHKERIKTAELHQSYIDHGWPQLAIDFFRNYLHF